ncbi:hypothetical protein [Candidatus Uabimicrobium sp. HlEnr_7]
MNIPSPKCVVKRSFVLSIINMKFAVENNHPQVYLFFWEITTYAPILVAG